MKNLLLCWCLLMTAFTTTVSADESQVRHIVVFKYKDGADPSEIERINQAFSQLPEKIPGILSFEMGVNNSPEGLNKGFTHVYQLTFTDVAAREAYLPHPDHKRFTDLLGELDILDDVFVVDYAF